MNKAVLRDPRLWVRPLALVTVSMGLHGVLLWLPVADSPVPEAKETPPEDRIKITALPLADAPITEAPAAELPKFSPDSPRPQPTPRVTERPPAPQSRPQPLARQQQERPAPQPRPRPTPQPTLEPTPPNPQPTPSEDRPPEPTNPPGNLERTPPAGDSPANPTNPPGNPTPPNPTGDPFANFPAYPNAQRGSESLFNPALQDAAQNTPDALPTVADFYQEQGPERDFTLTVAHEEDGLKVYEVAIANVTPRYLHLLTLEQKTVMMLLSEPLDQTTLARLQEVETLTAAERELEQFFAQLYRDRAIADFEVDSTVLANLPPALASDPAQLQPRGKIAQPLSTAKSEVLERMRQNDRYFFTPMEIPGTGLYQVHRDLSNVSVYFVALDGGQATGVITIRQ